ncbi:site-specific integrase [Peptoniphilus sp. MSJ-1]|uniref:Site-specific integrase n=1 Tax=Peptoniphilus ovalis TaxID=2841503 RepID=A0ABS6FHD4_9FIRM|nr:site-specific integrase [Peptoniphilus ovalis]MBU5669580.1 site-specific integrase [Peptoniphilus ovalis]
MANGIGGLGSLTYTIRNGKKYWTGRITLGKDINGKQVRKSFSSYKKSDVIDKMREASKEENFAGIINTDSCPLGQSLESWLLKTKAKEIKSTTLDAYIGSIRKYLLDLPFAIVDVRDLTVIMLQKYFDYIVEEMNCSHRSLMNIVTVIKMFLDNCIKLGIINKNICEYVDLPKVEKRTKKNNMNKYRVFSKDEQSKIIKNLDLSDPVEQMIYTDFFTGLRRNELRGLKWKAYKNGKIYVSEQVSRDYSFSDNGKKKILDKNALTTPKTENSERIVPLPELLIKYLDKWKNESMLKHFRIDLLFNDECFIFTDDLCNIIEEKRANRRLQKICKEIGIEPRPFHSIRHSYATRLFENGVEIKTVQMLLGHSNYETTSNIYTHVMPDTKEKAIQVFDKIYNSL